MKNYLLKKFRLRMNSIETGSGLSELTKTLVFNGFPRQTADVLEAYSTKNQPWLAIGTPWITEDATSWLEKNINQTDRVLEYGGGRSTLWWASKVESVTCVETSPEWATSLLLYAYSRPELLKKLRIHFIPAEWNPQFTTNGLRSYWKANRSSITHNDATILERDFVDSQFPGTNIILFDGSIRNTLFVYKMTVLDLSQVEIIVIDNTESPITSFLADELIPSEFERHDFAAAPGDIIPSHQKGKHMTSIFVKKSRRTLEIPTRYPTSMTLEQRQKHMHESDEDIEKAKSRVFKIKSHLADNLGLSLES